MAYASSVDPNDIEELDYIVITHTLLVIKICKILTRPKRHQKKM